MRALRLALPGILVLLVSLGVLSTHVTRADAWGWPWEFWCVQEPTVSVNGNPLIISVAVQQGNLAAITGPAQIVVAVPAGVNATLTSDNPLYFPDQVSIQTSNRHWNGQGAVPIDVSLVVPGQGSFPVQFLLKKPNVPLTNTVTGADNQTITHHVEFPVSLQH